MKDHNKTNTRIRDYNPSFIFICRYIYLYISYLIYNSKKKHFAIMILDRGKIFDTSVIKHSQEHVLYTVIKV